SARARAASIVLVGRQPAIERLDVDAELLRGAGLVATELVERPARVVALELAHREHLAAERQRLGRPRRAAVARQVGRGGLGAVGEQGAALDDVGELADVAWPGVVEQAGGRLA